MFDGDGGFARKRIIFGFCSGTHVLDDSGMSQIVSLGGCFIDATHSHNSDVGDNFTHIVIHVCPCERKQTHLN